MKINLSKKNKVIVTIMLFVVLGGTGGYLLWRVNQQKTLSETFTEAGCVYNKVAGTDRSTGCLSATATGAACNCGEKERGYDLGGILWCAEYSSTCTSDCGDGTCSSDENATSCASDCTKCGDNLCTGSETLTSCPGDCSVCGDNKCTGAETLASCPGDCSVCGDNKCTGSETAVTCSGDCLCKDLIWTNKPSGEYPINYVFPTITITNTNSKSTASTGIDIKLNGESVATCSTTIAATCYSLSADANGYQMASITLLHGSTNIAVGTYSLVVVLPVDTGSCAQDSVTTSASFTVAADAVVVVPETGIFDGVMSKIYLGTGFVFLGIVTTQFSKFGYLFNTLDKRNRVVLEEKKRRREESKRNRFERRFK